MQDDGYDGVQYDTFNGPSAAYRCVLCGETPLCNLCPTHILAGQTP